MKSSEIIKIMQKKGKSKAKDIEKEIKLKLEKIKERAQLGNEFVTINIFNVIFSDGKNFDVFKFPEIKNKSKDAFNLLINIVNLFHKIITFPPDERELLYPIDITNIQDKDLKRISNELKVLIEKINSDTITMNKFERLQDLYTIIFGILEKAGFNSILNIIDKGFLQFSFLARNQLLIKYLCFSMIKNQFLLDKEESPLYFYKNQIDLECDVCLKLLCDLLNNNIPENLNLIISYIILCFEGVKDIIKEYKLEKIIVTATNATQKIIDFYPDNFLITTEKIILHFIEEYEKLNLQEKNEP